VEARRPDPQPGLKADLLRGDAAYRRDESDELTQSGRALRAKAEQLQRHFVELQEASAALKAESEQLRREFQRRRASAR
jgi:molecular chaperone GrpE (heat shock protein)